MISLLLTLVVAIVIVVFLFVAIDYFSSAIGGDGRLWLLLKGLIVLVALVLVVQQTGVLA